VNTATKSGAIDSRARGTRLPTSSEHREIIVEIHVGRFVRLRSNLDLSIDGLATKLNRAMEAVDQWPLPLLQREVQP
jgi:hypothetical protein